MEERKIPTNLYKSFQERPWWFLHFLVKMVVADVKVHLALASEIHTISFVFSGQNTEQNIAESFIWNLLIISFRKSVWHFRGWAAIYKCCGSNSFLIILSNRKFLNSFLLKVLRSPTLFPTSTLIRRLDGVSCQSDMRKSIMMWLLV